MAISRERSETAEYIVLSAPKIAPMAMTAGDQSAEHGDQRGHGVRLLGVVVDLAAHLNVQAGIGRDGILELLQGLREKSDAR